MFVFIFVIRGKFYPARFLNNLVVKKSTSEPYHAKIQIEPRGCFNWLPVKREY